MIYKGDTGTVIQLDTQSDISSATLVKIKVRKPSGVILDWIGALQGTTAIRYVTQANDLDESGVYKLQGYVESPAWCGSSDITSMQVDNTLS